MILIVEGATISALLWLKEENQASG
uniref:Uncharacterized protein n=1 Tax=Arundo donax TaxID=35708 RepID=A0A0A8ZPF4_ARUDO